MNDPIVEEVRRWRMEHTLKFGGDLELICEDLRRLQRDSGYQVVRLPPKLLASKKKLADQFPNPSPQSLLRPG